MTINNMEVNNIVKLIVSSIVVNRPSFNKLDELISIKTMMMIFEIIQNQKDWVNKVFIKYKI
ncbi:hypothetical protein [Pseudopedobacter beijingensis]|uniref:Uncharacterized protein n=1 Tax=Pseudopedobacter beijingensis TaxID=1207056 RepID=A0ABW4I9J5_9SPHI